MDRAVFRSSRPARAGHFASEIGCVLIILPLEYA
jgi:hypothetical protein